MPKSSQNDTPHYFFVLLSIPWLSWYWSTKPLPLHTPPPFKNFREVGGGGVSLYHHSYDNIIPLPMGDLKYILNHIDPDSPTVWTWPKLNAPNPPHSFHDMCVPHSLFPPIYMYQVNVNPSPRSKFPRFNLIIHWALVLPYLIQPSWGINGCCHFHTSIWWVGWPPPPPPLYPLPQPPIPIYPLPFNIIY